MAAGLVLLLAGCQSPRSASERAARETLGRAEPAPEAGPRPVLPVGATPEEYVRWALLGHPAVRAAWAEWRAAVEAIAPARALPDPQLTLQADVAGTVMSLMPGVMFDFMAAGRRAAMAQEAVAGAEVARRNYDVVRLRVAVEVRRALVELDYLAEAERLRTAALAALERTAAVAATRYATGRNMEVSLEPQVRWANEAGKVRAELATLAARRQAARATLKAALGLTPDAPDPAWPVARWTVTALPDEAALWARIQQTNTKLAAMRAMVAMAVAGEEVAARSRASDVTAGLMADVKAAPWMWRPTVAVSLPVWREKLAALAAGARARREAAGAQVEAETLALAAELARMLAMVRAADAMIAYLDTTALPSVARTRAVTVSTYQTGAGMPTMIAETAAMELAMRAERLAAWRERELAVVDILALAERGATAAPDPA